MLLEIFLSIRPMEFFCLKRARHWLEFRIRFSRYNMRSFQRALVGFNKLGIHFILREFSWVSFPNGKLSYKAGGRLFFRFKKKYIFFPISILICFEIVYIWPMHCSLDKKIWFTVTFLPFTSQSESQSVPDMNCFDFTFNYWR